ncbi:hypothetical protein [Bradyrhizobium sp. 150]|nr:hypothetical protein [Bradyrhizobium sp. 150]
MAGRVLCAISTLLGTAFLIDVPYQFGHASGYTHALRNFGRLP